MGKFIERCDKAKFKRPNHEDYPNVFWFFNGDMNGKIMKKQLNEMRSNGIWQPVIVPWEGLTIEYLSDEWFEKVRCACKVAQELGMTLMLYDEFNWPSGYAGGKLLKSNPEYRAKCLTMNEMEVYGPVHRSVSVPKGLSQVVIAARVNPDLTLSNLVDLTDKARGNEVSCDFPIGKWKLMFFGMKEGDYQPPFSKSYYTDLLDPRAVKKFIALTHERYYEKLSEYFGSVIKGIFTDEPGMYFNVWWFNPASIPWTLNFFHQFTKRKGYDLRKYLPALWYALDDEDRTTRVRVDFFDVLATLYQESYFKLLHDWCVRHNIRLMGHLLSEEDLRFIVRLEADYFKAMQYLEIPGVDNIGNWDKKAITCKMGSSVAHAFNRPIVFSETFALFGWGLAFELMKIVTDEQFVMGINKQLISAFFYSIKGKRKHNVPPSIYQNTFWPYFRSYADYAARLSYMLTNGKHIAPIAVLIPTATAQSLITALDLSDVSKLQTLLENISNFLLDNQYDFDYIDESLFNEISVIKRSASDVRICLGDEDYKVLILPGSKVLSSTTWKRIEDFKKKGGTVLSIEDTISSLKTDQLLKALHKFRDIEVLNPKGQKFKVHEELARGGCVNEGYVAPLLEGHELGLMFDVDAEFFDMVGCDVATGNWVKGPGEISMRNFKERPPNVTLTLRRDGPDGETLVSKRYKKVETSRLTLEFKPLPRGKYYLQVTDPKGPIGWWSRDFNEDNRTSAYSDKKHYPGHDRTLFLRQINYTTNMPFINYLHLMRGKRHVYFVTNSAPYDVDLLIAFKETGIPELWDAENGQVKKHFEFDQEDGKTITRLQLSKFSSIFIVFSKGAETPHITKTNMGIDGVKANGDKIIANATAHQAGENFVEVEYKGKKYYSNVHAQDPKIIKISNWNFKAEKYEGKLKGEWSKALPYFSGKAVYSKELSIPDSILRNRKVILECQEVANIMGLKINGKSIGIRCWSPYRFDITSCLRPGRNKIIIEVINTPANKNDRMTMPSGLLTPVQICSYENHLMRLKVMKS